jgi:hypothetical protein
MAEEKVEAAKAEVRRLPNVCTDFTDLNKCCLKDNFPLARIYQIINSAAASGWLCWIVSLDITKSSSAQKTKRKPVLSLCSEHTATSKCRRAFGTQAQLSAE